MEGIVLRSIPFEDHFRIITLFTFERGILSVMMKEAGKKNLALLNITSVLSVSEFEITSSRSDLYRLKDASLIDDFQEIRTDLAKLTSTGKILRRLLETQLPEKPSPRLYLLLRHFLEKMKGAPNPENLYLSFYLKLLSYEGLFPKDRELSPIPFTQEEWQIADHLCHCRSFEELGNLATPKGLEDKLTRLLN